MSDFISLFQDRSLHYIMIYSLFFKEFHVISIFYCSFILTGNRNIFKKSIEKNIQKRFIMIFFNFAIFYSNSKEFNF